MQFFSHHKINKPNETRIGNIVLQQHSFLVAQPIYFIKGLPSSPPEFNHDLLLELGPTEWIFLIIWLENNEEKARLVCLKIKITRHKI